jgi:hypothetical protein
MRQNANTTYADEMIVTLRVNGIINWTNDKKVGGKNGRFIYKPNRGRSRTRLYVVVRVHGYIKRCVDAYRNKR